VKGFHLDEALELVKHQFAATVVYPLKKTPRKRSAPDPDPKPGTSKQKEQGKKKQKNTGTKTPKDSLNNRKFDSRNMPKNLQSLFQNHLKKSSFFINNSDLRLECIKLVANSLAKRTWNKYSSALSLWHRFSHNKALSSFSAVEFTCWCSKYASIKSSTVKEYVSAINKMKFLLGFDSKNNEKDLEKILLRGMENIQSKTQKPKKKVTPVTLQILENIKKGLDSGICSSCSKKSIWALSLAAFWGLLRLGEILPPHAESFDKTTTLLWGDVEINDDNVVFHLKSPKTKTIISREVVLYKLSGDFFCPVTSIKKLKKALQKRGLWGEDLPVFMRASGKSLTKSSFLKGLNTALNPSKENKIKLQGKSFRSGIPSILDKNVESTGKKVIQILGRWKGPSYRCYIRNPVPENRWIYEKISDLLLKDFLRRHDIEDSEPDSG